MNSSHLSLYLLTSLLFASIGAVKSAPTPSHDQASAFPDDMVTYGPPDQYPKLYSNREVNQFISDFNRLEYEGLKALDVRNQLGAPIWRAAIMVLMNMEPEMLEGFRDPEDSFNLAYDRQFAQRCNALLAVFNKHEEFLADIVNAPPPVPYKAQILYRLGLICRQLVTPDVKKDIYQHYVESSVHPDKNRWRFREQLNPK